MNLHAEMLIDGHFVGGPCDRSIAKIVVRAPYDGAIVGTAAEGGWSEANAAIQAATEAFKGWQRSPRAERAALLRRIAALVRERTAELEQLLTLEVGKPITWSKGEVTRLGLTFDLGARLCESQGQHEVDLGYDPRGSGYSACVERFPVGPVLGIVPYNWPLNLAAHKVAPALAVGCTIVLKPSSQAPLSTLSLARLIHDAGCPHGVVNAVVCPPRVAEKMALDPRIKKVSFTGSPQVGWALKEKLPRKKVTLELGGDASAIVMPDADLDWAVQRIIAGKFGYAGQICISIQHARVHEQVYEVVREKLIEGTRSCPTGNPSDPTIVCGPLISAAAADRVMTRIDEAVAGGAHVLAGGTRDGNVVAPTLLERVPARSMIGCEEIFGPVLALSKFSDVEEAIQDVNASRYGIHCGVFTGDQDVAERCFRELEVAGVVINDYPTLRFDALPYGGVKDSGFGREGVSFAMEEMTEPKSWVRRLA